MRKRITINDFENHPVPCEVLPDLPCVGDDWLGEKILAIEPNPLECPQPTGNVYRYSIWKIITAHGAHYVGVEEPEAETI